MVFRSGQFGETILGETEAELTVHADTSTTYRFPNLPENIRTGPGEVVFTGLPRIPDIAVTHYAAGRLNVYEVFPGY